MVDFDKGYDEFRRNFECKPGVKLMTFIDSQGLAKFKKWIGLENIQTKNEARAFVWMLIKLMQENRKLWEQKNIGVFIEAPPSQEMIEAVSEFVDAFNMPVDVYMPDPEQPGEFLQGGFTPDKKSKPPQPPAKSPSVIASIGQKLIGKFTGANTREAVDKMVDTVASQQIMMELHAFLKTRGIPAEPDNKRTLLGIRTSHGVRFVDLQEMCQCLIRNDTRPNRRDDFYNYLISYAGPASNEKLNINALFDEFQRHN